MARMIRSNFRDPIGLFGRLLRSRSREAYYAMATGAAAVLATPLDLLLSGREARLYESAPEPSQPVVFIMGAPRSGTTILSQVLINSLPVAYFNNLTQIFPRSPITANRVFAPFVRVPASPRYRSYYGRTAGLAGTNDGLRLWDRWWTGDRYRVPEAFDEATGEAMRSFFGAYESAFGKPIINKSNALATCSAALAEVLPTARFICVEREARFNIQSIIVARETIQGSRDLVYGVQAPDGWPKSDYFEAVCSQVLYHRASVREQRRRMGEDRMWIVGYEEFCREPLALVDRVGREWLGVKVEPSVVARRLPALKVSNRVTIGREDFDLIESRLDALPTKLAAMGIQAD